MRGILRYAARMADRVRERQLVFLIAAVQFVNVLDFMIVMPLGPDFAQALQIPASTLGVVNGSYTLAAGVMGLLAAPFLDRFDRRTALMVTIFGLVSATALGGCAQGLTSLVLARVVAGAFGGPAISLCYSIIGDVIDVERRGRALGAVMGAYAMASVLGVPAALQLSEWAGWRTPFWATAALGAAIMAAAAWALPSLRGHLAEGSDGASAGRAVLAMMRRPVVRDAVVLAFLLNLAHFMVAPNLAAFVEFNRHYPRAHLGLLFLAGGAANFLAMRALGAMVDRAGALAVGVAGAVASAIIVWVTFVQPLAWLPVLAFFVLYMVTTSCRTVPFNTIILAIPAPHERARFMSLQSAIHHMGAAAGAFFAAHVLETRPDQTLQGMPTVGILFVVLVLGTPLFLWRIQRAIAR